MNQLSVGKRHEIAHTLDRLFPDPRRVSALASRAGVTMPVAQGVESGFARITRLLIAAAAAERIDALLDIAETAAGGGAEDGTI